MGAPAKVRAAFQLDGGPDAHALTAGCTKVKAPSLAPGAFVRLKTFGLS
jgi:hypothetical protein